jgi:hypothetical protein
MISEHSESAPVALACAPVHKRALGIAVGLVVGGGIFALTAFHIAAPGAGEGLNLGLLSQYFYGYDVTWRGAAIGFSWGFITGFVVGWFLAFVRNLVVTVLAFSAMSEEEVTRTRQFLDHI